MTSRAPSQRVAIGLSLSIFGLYVVYVYSGAGQELYLWSKGLAPYAVRQYLGMSKRYLLQYGHVLFLFGLLVLSRYVFVSEAPLPISGRVTRWLNRYSTAIFLFHFPVLFCLAAAVEYDRTSVAEQLALLGATLAVSCLLGRLCFAAKPAFDRFQRQAVSALDGRFPRAAGARAAGEPLRITRSHSEFLDLVKLVAMLSVVLGHFSFTRLSSLGIPGFDGSAPRFAVPAFFVISGYFLMLSIDRARYGALATIVRRASSLYFIVVPMLLVTLALDTIGFRAEASLYGYSDYYSREPLERAVILDDLLEEVASPSERH